MLFDLPPSVLFPLKLFLPTLSQLFLLLPCLELFLLLGALVPMGLYWLWKLRLLHASAKLNDSNFSLCSFFGGARYLGRGIGSPGL